MIRDNVFIGTIPRAGTNYLNYFFIYLDLFLRNHIVPADIEHGELVELWQRIDLKNILDKMRQSHYKYEKIGISKLFIGHAYCPGFPELADNPIKEQWNLIPSSDNWWNAIGKVADKNRDIFYPQRSRNAVIIFLYRNPFDSMVSLYRHVRNHRNMPRQLPRFKEWLKNIFPQYVKSFASYYFSQQKFPDTILMISYEKLMRDNKTALSDIAQFMGISQEILDGPAFEAARLVTGKDSMRRLEFFLGRTLAGDQRLGPSKESHIRGGSVGKWKDSFTVRNYEYAVGELEKMQIPLNFFETE